MKVLIFSDAHFSFKHLDAASTSLKQVQFYSERSDVEAVFFLGDLFESRTHVHTKVITELCSILKTFNKPIFAIVGNHDMYSDQCGDSLLHYLPNVEAFGEPFYAEENKIFLIPWTREKVDIPEDAKYVFGHIEIDLFFAGFKGNFPLREVLDRRELKHVFLGHIHHPGQPHEKVTYIGPTFRTDFGEEDIQPRCILLDLESGEYESLNLPSPVYKTLTYGEEAPEDVDYVRVKIPKNVDRKEAALKYSGIPLIFDTHNFEEARKEISEFPEIEELIEFFTKKKPLSDFDKNVVLKEGLDLYKEAIREINH